MSWIVLKGAIVGAVAVTNLLVVAPSAFAAGAGVGSGQDSEALSAARSQHLLRKDKDKVLNTPAKPGTGGSLFGGNVLDQGTSPGASGAPGSRGAPGGSRAR
jgi:hypothetical protein